MIKVSAILGASVVTALLVSMLGLNQKEIEGSQLIDPITSSDKLEKCLDGETEECLALFGNIDYEVLTVEDINVLEKEEDVDLGFDVKNYLPRNFNPYSTLGDFKTSSKDDNYDASDLDRAATLGTFIERGSRELINVDDIVILEDDGDIELGFNVRDYLPRSFNPYASM